MNPEFPDFFDTIRGEAPVGTAFANFTAYHGLRKMLTTLDTLHRDELLKMLDAITLPNFESPEGTQIKVVPSGRSQEIPLPVETYDHIDGDWVALSPDSTSYGDHVNTRGGQSYICGDLIQQDLGSRELYVYQPSRRVRVHLNNHVAFDSI